MSYAEVVGWVAVPHCAPRVNETTHERGECILVTGIASSTHLCACSARCVPRFKNPKLIKAGLVPIPPNDREFVDQLWPLYKQTGEKNGFTVLSEEEFYDFHLTVPNLEVYMVRVSHSRLPQKQ